MTPGDTNAAVARKEKKSAHFPPPEKPSVTVTEPAIYTRSRTISIKPENQKDRNGTVNGNQDPLNKEAREFTQEQLDKVWLYFTESIAQQYPNFYSIISTRKSTLKEDFVLEIALDNKAQDMTFNERKAELLEFLRLELRNQMIRFEIIMNPSQNEPKPFTADEKYRAMVAKNPLLKELKEKLDLELEL